MKYSLIVLVCILNLSCGGQPQENMNKYFIKENIDCDFHNSESNKYYKLVFSNEKNSVIRCSYFFDFSNYSESQKIEIIEELLSYEGDTSLCSVKPKCYDPKRSQTVPSKVEVYSIQVEALFIINNIILSDPYSYSAFPILRNKEGTMIEAVSGSLVNKAYSFYREWLEQVKKNGLNNITVKKILPLGNNAEVFWF